MNEQSLASNKFLDFLKLMDYELRDFTPICYYDKTHREALIFQVKDCSYREIEFDDYTIMLQNHVEGKEIVGLKIHNINNRYHQLTNGVEFNSITNYIEYILKKNGQLFNNTISFLKICESLEIDTINKITNLP